MKYIVATAGYPWVCLDCAAALYRGEARGIVDGTTRVPLVTTDAKGSRTLSTVLVVDGLKVDLDAQPQTLGWSACPLCAAPAGLRVEVRVLHASEEPLHPETAHRAHRAVTPEIRALAAVDLEAALAVRDHPEEVELVELLLDPETTERERKAAIKVLAQEKEARRDS